MYFFRQYFTLTLERKFWRKKLLTQTQPNPSSLLDTTDPDLFRPRPISKSEVSRDETCKAFALKSNNQGLRQCKTIG